jgi:uncharacterized flavoprotein (TIGR03862 family)
MAKKQVAIIGGGPSGLMTADILSAAGHDVSVYEAMPTMARKLLMAGKSGLNITHSEPYSAFIERFGNAKQHLQPALDDFGPYDVRDWMAELGQQTFVGTSGRVFPDVMKASPLLRTWLHRLEQQGVKLHTRHRWIAFNGDLLTFQTPTGTVEVRSDATLLSLGGASWPRLGSDAAWVPTLRDKGIVIADFKPANCGFDLPWSDVFLSRFAGAAIKSVVASSAAGNFQGEFVISKHGVEGSLIYAHSAVLRDALLNTGKATLFLDLAPGKTQDKLASDLAKANPKDSFTNRLRKKTGLSDVKIALLRELTPEITALDPADIAAKIKRLALPVVATRPIAEAISVAGGIEWSQLDENYMLRPLQGMFAAGEMLDWEAPTGGYLLTACLATGKAAAKGMLKFLNA